MGTLEETECDKIIEEDLKMYFIHLNLLLLSLLLQYEYDIYPKMYLTENPSLLSSFLARLYALCAPWEFLTGVVFESWLHE